MGHVFEIPTQYELIDTLGTGAYGVVVSAVDKFAEQQQNNDDDEEDDDDDDK